MNPTRVPRLESLNVEGPRPSRTGRSLRYVAYTLQQKRRSHDFPWPSDHYKSAATHAIVFE
ncbi:MAG TPA: hypothetical protein VFF31_22935, partial [Blastocatellia bacterium]|nr:hypothetical protein [Blastocatellia bacterium]